MSESATIMTAPRITKVTVNIGVGEGGSRLQNAESVLSLLTGGTPIRTLGRIQNRDLKVRKGAPIGCKITIRDKASIEKFLTDAFWVRENGLVGELDLQRVAAAELTCIIDENVTTIVEIQLCTAALDGRLALDSADLPLGIVGGDLLVAQFSILVEYTAIVLFAKGQNIHQTDATACVANDSTIDKCLAFVQDSANLSSGIGKAENIADDG